MMKKQISIILLFILIMVPSLTHAAAYFGTTSESSYLWADSSYGDDEFLSLSYESCSDSATISFYENVGGTATIISSLTITSGANTIEPPPMTAAIKLFSNDGKEIYLTAATTNNPNSTSLTFDNPGTCGSSGGSDPSNGGGNTFIIQCPGWSEAMGTLENILNKIPPPPNWNDMALAINTQVIPGFVNDLENMLGAAPTTPTAPSSPSSNISDRGISNLEPKMDPVPGLSESTFSKNDLEQQAPVIEFREDPTGGFEITDPVDALPDFPTNDLPVPGETNAGEWGLNQPVELDNPYPAPSGQEETTPIGPAPTPPDTTDPAPIPPDGYTPPSPDDGTGGTTDPYSGKKYYKDQPT